MKRIINAVIGLLTLLYPFAVYFSVQHIEPRLVAVLLAVLLLARLGGADGPMRPMLFMGLLFAAFAAWHNQLLTLRFYPVIVNLALLALFATSLFYPPSVVERMARLKTPDLPPQGIIYTRRVTQVWCLFFMLNGSVALITAIWSSFEVWSLYNGFIAYVLIGLLFAGEYWVRQRTQA